MIQNLAWPVVKVITWNDNNPDFWFDVWRPFLKGPVIQNWKGLPSKTPSLDMFKQKLHRWPFARKTLDRIPVLARIGYSPKSPSSVRFYGCSKSYNLCKTAMIHIMDAHEPLFLLGQALSLSSVKMCICTSSNILDGVLSSSFYSNRNWETCDDQP